MKDSTPEQSHDFETLARSIPTAIIHAELERRIYELIPERATEGTRMRLQEICDLLSLDALSVRRYLSKLRKSGKILLVKAKCPKSGYFVDMGYTRRISPGQIAHAGN